MKEIEYKYEKHKNLIAEIEGKKKIRDYKILQLLAEGHTQQETAEIVKLARATISIIKNKNLDILDKLTMETEFATKMGRIRYINRELRRKAKEKSKKDKILWIEQMRKEREGEEEKPTFVLIECGIPRPSGLPPLNRDAKVKEEKCQSQNPDEEKRHEPS